MHLTDFDKDGKHVNWLKERGKDRSRTQLQRRTQEPRSRAQRAQEPRSPTQQPRSWTQRPGRSGEAADPTGGYLNIYNDVMDEEAQAGMGRESDQFT